MGYLFTTCKDMEKLDIYKFDTIMATDEEVEIAKLFLLSEFDDDFVEMENNLSEEAAYYVYKRTLVIFLRYIQEWMNTASYSGFMGREYRPSAAEEAGMVIITRIFLPEIASEYTKGNSSLQEYTISRVSDKDILSLREEFASIDKPSEEGLIDIDSTAFHVIDYERVIPVKVTDRKGFIFFCEDSEGESYVVPYHQLFRTEEEADKLVTERNERRYTAIEKYHLMDHTDDEKLQRNRRTALDWLFFNQNLPSALIEELEKSLQMKTAV